MGPCRPSWGTWHFWGSLDTPQTGMGLFSTQTLTWVEEYPPGKGFAG
jgi:hypothetical protein